MPFEIVRNDITKMHVDAIVNPTNADMYGTAGVDGKIHEIEGITLRQETKKLGKLELGQSKLTKAYELPSKYIIHTAGPVWQSGGSGQADILRACYKSALALANEEGFNSIAFPLISSGSYGCPKDLALNIAVTAIGEFLLFNDMMVYLVVFDKTSYQLSETLFTAVESYIDDHYIEQDHFIREKALSSRSEPEYYDELQEIASSIVPRKKLKAQKSLDQAVKHLEESFSQMLLRLIDERGLKDPDVYKKANVTKQTFSKIRNNVHYKPTKQTILAFAISLELNLDEAKDLLLRAGFALSKSSRFDVIMSYFFEMENYDIYEINEVLFAYDEQLLGVI